MLSIQLYTHVLELAAKCSYLGLEIKLNSFLPQEKVFELPDSLTLLRHLACLVSVLIKQVLNLTVLSIKSLLQALLVFQCNFSDLLETGLLLTRFAQLVRDAINFAQDALLVNFGCLQLVVQVFNLLLEIFE